MCFTSCLRSFPRNLSSFSFAYEVSQSNWEAYLRYQKYRSSSLEFSFGSSDEQGLFLIKNLDIVLSFIVVLEAESALHHISRENSMLEIHIGNFVDSVFPITVISHDIRSNYSFSN